MSTKLDMCQTTAITGWSSHAYLHISTAVGAVPEGPKRVGAIGGVEVTARWDAVLTTVWRRTVAAGQGVMLEIIVPSHTDKTA